MTSRRIAKGAQSKVLTEVLKSLALVVFFSGETANAWDWRGNVSTEFTYFPQKSLGQDNWQYNASLGADVELTHDLSDNVRLTFHPFMRWDDRDEERTRLWARELMLSTSGDTWEFNAGLGTVFWGVAESRNPVDIVNQIDNVEDIAGDAKLGQLMLNFNWFSDYGDFEVYFLPQFHEQTFRGEDGRPSIGIQIDPDLTSYESSAGNQHRDVALRWINSIDIWDVGLHYFDGTARQPLLVPTLNGQTPVLAPRYHLVRQFGIDG